VAAIARANESGTAEASGQAVVWFSSGEIVAKALVRGKRSIGDGGSGPAGRENRTEARTTQNACGETRAAA